MWPGRPLAGFGSRPVPVGAHTGAVSRLLALMVLAAARLAGYPQTPATAAVLSEAPCVVSSASYDEYVAFLKTRPPVEPRDTAFDEATFRRNLPAAWFQALKSGTAVRCRRITYASDGLGVVGFIVEPVTPGRHPLVVVNRGGNLAFGALRTGDLLEMTGWALEGYVAVATQYRGVDGGEGREEFGGADVADVLNLAALARALPTVDASRTYMYGVSRGGMQTLLALKAGLQVRAAAIVGAPTDLAASLTHRPEMEEVYRDLMPDYARRRDEHLRTRSAVHWPEALTAPLLILHGGADWRVWPGNALALASALQSRERPYGLVIYAGDDHPITANWPDARARIREWFRTY
jgi:dipeptidyl aminopeptidase/acylaminoacyl peptidase